MAEAADDIDEPTAAQLAAWAGEQGTTLDEMRARVAANRAAVMVTAARMARMVQEASSYGRPDQAQSGQDGPVQADR